MTRESRDQLPDGFFAIESAAARRRRVARIQQELHDGEYDVAASAVADAIVSFFSREIEPGDGHNAGLSADSC